MATNYYVGSFQYFDDAGQRRTATLKQTDVLNPGTPAQRTTDPAWITVDEHGQDSREYERLPVTDTNGSLYCAKVHATYAGRERNREIIGCTFETCRLNGAENTDGHQYFKIIDWDGGHWAVSAIAFSPFPSSPVFHLGPVA